MTTSVPEIKANAGLYRVLYADERVNFRIERVYDEKSRGVSGEIEVMTTYPGIETFVSQGRVGLLSTVSQKTFVNRLKEHSPALEGLDWTRMLARVCREVLKLHRQGEPVISLATYQRDERVSYRVDPLFPDRKDSLVHAPGGMGKTLLCANYFGVLVASGMQANGFSVEPGNVLIVDYETDADESQERSLAVARGLGIELPTNLYYRRAAQALASDIEQLQREVLDKEIAMVVVDSAGPACGGEPESAEATIKYFSALRSLNITTLTIAHVSKEKNEHPFGSVYWTNQPRRVFRLTSTQAPGDSSYTLGIINTKSNWGQRLPPIGLRVSFESDAVRFEKTDVSSVPELDKERSLRVRLKNLLTSSGAMLVQEMAVELDEEEGTIRTRLNEWRDKDFVIVNQGERPSQWGVLIHQNG